MRVHECPTCVCMQCAKTEFSLSFVPDSGMHHQQRCCLVAVVRTDERVVSKCVCGAVCCVMAVVALFVGGGGFIVCCYIQGYRGNEGKFFIDGWEVQGCPNNPALGGQLAVNAFTYIEATGPALKEWEPLIIKKLEESKQEWIQDNLKPKGRGKKGEEDEKVKEERKKAVEEEANLACSTWEDIQEWWQKPLETRVQELRAWVQEQINEWKKENPSKPLPGGEESYMELGRKGQVSFHVVMPPIQEAQLLNFFCFFFSLQRLQHPVLQLSRRRAPRPLLGTKDPVVTRSLLSKLSL